MVLSEGPTLRLRDLTAADLATLTRIWGDPTVMADMSSEVRTERECAALLDQARRDAQERPRRSYRMAVVRRRDDVMIGTTAVDLERHRSAFSHSSSLLPEHQRTGAAVEGFALVCELVFGSLNRHRLTLTCTVDNTAVERLALAAGAALVGTIPEYACKNGSWRDDKLFSLVDHQWRASRLVRLMERQRQRHARGERPPSALAEA
ncbi:GNAT family N-acetyltransferase [Actinomadura decatromicini]|uniref:GNAT family N-acetyltransferase n=1 Tax=Actinomadura decatromicini TaxID=2604572 RepID=UPI001653254F|nr:GNAT family N-acetyltransferase [Actinomadura decatromicini]